MFKSRVPFIFIAALSDLAIVVVEHIFLVRLQILISFLCSCCQSFSRSTLIDVALSSYERHRHHHRSSSRSVSQNSPYCLRRRLASSVTTTLCWLSALCLHRRFGERNDNNLNTLFSRCAVSLTLVFNRRSLLTVQRLSVDVSHALLTLLATTSMPMSTNVPSLSTSALCALVEKLCRDELRERRFFFVYFGFVIDRTCYFILF